MRILIVTQVVDTEDPVLGFFCDWVEEFAKHVEQISVVCLREASHSFPKNVRVYSLGKERGAVPRATYALRFFSLVWRLRREYDTVFVHMNSEYVVLAGAWWRMCGKRILLWRNHRVGGCLTYIAACMSHEVYATSPYSYVYRIFPKKTKLMPVGIMTERFTPDIHIPRDRQSVLMLGRLSPVKKIDLLLRALVVLQKRGVACSAHIVGDPQNPEDGVYVESLRAFIADNDLTPSVTWSSGVPHYETPTLYRAHAVLVNLTANGSLDKTIFEAMACGTLVVTTNGALRGEIPNLFLLGPGEEAVAERIERVLSCTASERATYGESLRTYVVEKHSLKKLAEKLFMNTTYDI